MSFSPVLKQKLGDAKKKTAEFGQIISSSKFMGFAISGCFGAGQLRRGAAGAIS